VDVAEPPRIVVESRASCASTDRAEEFVHDALGNARAPGHAWTVRMRVFPAPRGIRAEGQIYDDLGLMVAARELSSPTGDCQGVARAVGVWASLVLQQELARAPAAPSVSATVSPTAQAADSQSTDVLWPAPAVVEKAPDERDWFLHHEETRTVEIGVAGFLMSGMGTGAMAGAGPYVIIEAGRGVFLRPSLAFGEALTSLNSPPIVHAMWIGGRFDTCLRLPGLYTKNRGIQLDMCGGTDVGMVSDSTDGIDLPFVSFGPSIDLRGELGSLLSASIRGVAGLNVTSETLGPVYQPLWSGRLELAFSWKVK
jgi:hypothetical protein